MANLLEDVRATHSVPAARPESMSKAVFTTKVLPAYDDLPEVRYHFPRTYLAQASAAVGDWIVYYEPRRVSSAESSRGGRQCYFSVARVAKIEPDIQLPDHYYAQITDYLEFDVPVPFRTAQAYFESALMRPDGQTSKGAFGRSVRLLPDGEFEAILAAGFPGQTWRQDETWSEQNFPPEERRRIDVTLSRPYRDEAFRRHVRQAYDNRCAISGLRLISGGGKPEVHAAHIQPVASNGPDSVRNGLALSGTLHWMFDRGLVTVDEHLNVVCADSLPEDARRLVTSGKTLILPRDPTLRPHQTFLDFHRRRVFQG